jgi:hypothetical protein
MSIYQERPAFPHALPRITRIRQRSAGLTGRALALDMSGYFFGCLMDSKVRSTSNRGQYRLLGAGCSTFIIAGKGASLNHGNSTNGRNSSSSPMRIHNPCLEMLVTSTAKVLIPSALDFIFSLPYDFFNPLEFGFGQTCAPCQGGGRVQPELCFSSGTLHVYMHPGFLT